MAANTPIAAEPITVTVDSRALGACLAACMKHYATDDTRPTLNRVHIIAEGSFLIFECTDGYRALRYRILAEGIPETPAGTYHLDRSEVKVIYATLPKSGPYQLELQPDFGGFPNLVSILPKYVLNVRIKLKYLQDAITACKGMESVLIQPSSNNSALMICGAEQTDNGSDATVIIMPMAPDG